MSWDYSGFLGEKVEAGRRLLASDPAWAGSQDLQVRPPFGHGWHTLWQSAPAALCLLRHDGLIGECYLQVVVEDKDLMDALRRTFLLPSGELRQGLSLHDERQGLIHFLLSARRKLEMRTMQILEPVPLMHCVSRAVRAGGSGGQ